MVADEILAGEQRRVAGLVELRSLEAVPDFVVGVDAAYVDDDDNQVSVAVGSAVVVDTKSFEVVEEATSTMSVMGYRPGLLGLREAPVLLAAIDKLSTVPELVVCDGHGVAHPLRAGLACHVGVGLGVPSVGCAKELFVGDHGELGRERGAVEFIVEGGEVVGAVVRTRNDVKPVYVSPGHLIDVEACVRVVLALTPRFRLPETTRAADQLARRAEKTVRL